MCGPEAITNTAPFATNANNPSESVGKAFTNKETRFTTLNDFIKAVIAKFKEFLSYFNFANKEKSHVRSELFRPNVRVDEVFLTGTSKDNKSYIESLPTIIEALATKSKEREEYNKSLESVKNFKPNPGAYSEVKKSISDPQLIGADPNTILKTAL